MSLMLMERVKELLGEYRPSPAAGTADPVNSAVLVPLFELRGQIWTTFIKRSESVGLHRGQMAFPGGMCEPCDQGEPLRTALRETEEEIGLLPGDVEVVGALKLRPTLKSGLRVQPFVGIIPWPCSLSPDPLEIRSIHHAPLKDLATGVRLGENPFGLPPPVYTVDGFPVWGLTAGMVSELLAVLEPVIGKE